MVRDIKVFPGEKVVTQHQILVSEIEWKFAKQNKKSFTPKLRMWKLKDQDVVCRFQDELNNLVESDANLILQLRICQLLIEHLDPLFLSLRRWW